MEAVEMEMIGEWILCDGSTQVELWTPWFTRAATNAVFTYEEIVVVGSVTLSVAVFHRNSDEVGNGSSAGSSWTTAGQFSYANVTNLKEMVRFKVILTPEFGAGAVCFRFLPPTWYDNPSG
jgi:hypothetical protein